MMVIPPIFCLVQLSCPHPRCLVTVAVLGLRCAEPNDKDQVPVCHLKLSLLSLVVSMCPSFSQDKVNFCSSCGGGRAWNCVVVSRLWSSTTDIIARGVRKGLLLPRWGAWLWAKKSMVGVENLSAIVRCCCGTSILHVNHPLFLYLFVSNIVAVTVPLSHCCFQ